MSQAEIGDGNDYGSVEEGVEEEEMLARYCW